jgi:hypothetical protein
MIAALLAGLAIPPLAQSTTVVLYRGATVGGDSYWSVSDTDLDSTQPDKSKGGLFTLEGGKGKTILVKFGELERVIPQFARITKATLFLSPSSSDQPQFTGIGALKSPWGEGPSFTATLGRAVEEPKAIQLAATWRHRRSGKNAIEWQQTGATGPDDVTPITGAQIQTLDKEVAITGLASAVQAMRDRWFENNGFALAFDGKCEFFSNQAKVGRPRLEVEYTVDRAPAAADLSVEWIDRTPEHPRNGEEVVYRAAVKNVGSTPALGFQGQWVVAERPGSKFGIAKQLAPGDETTIEFRKTFAANLEDHRAQPIQFRIYPGAAEPNSNNNAVEIHEDAIPIAVTGAKVSGSSMQPLFRQINQSYFEQSRFSYATDGVIERIRWVPSQESADITVDLAGPTSEKDSVLRVVSALTGLAHDQPTSVTAGGRIISLQDPYAGLSGIGDSRNDGLIPAGIPMLYVPVASPLFDTFPIESTNLLSGTETFAINSALNKRGKQRLGVLWDIPPTIILRATDMTGKPLDGAELAFFQMVDGKVPDSPTQTILTKEGGTVILENRDVEGGILDKDAPHQLKRNPFGNLRSDGANGTILIKAQINGETEWGHIKAWELADAFHRGNKAAAIVDVRFNAPAGILDHSTNLAKGRLVSDKSESLPAKLSGLVDDDPTTSSDLGPNAGDWVEIDLGRDRPIGEVRLVLKDSTMPAKFDIQTYATGQTPPEVEAWVKDLNFRWTLKNRGTPEGSSLAIPYRGPMTRARFIRIVNRSGGIGRIAEIKVIPLKAE